MKELVIFDVDGTIVKGQSQRLFLKYLRLKKIIGSLFYYKLLLWFIFYRMGFVKDPKKPMVYAFSFMKGKSIDEISSLVHDFFNNVLRKFIYSDAIELIINHQNADREVILVSNTMEPIIHELANYLKISNFFSTNLELENGVFTGNILSDAYGDNKASIVTSYSNKNNYDLRKAWAYSDHKSDQKLLSLVGNPVAANPSSAMLSIARERHWPIVRFKKIKNDIIK